MQAPPCGQSISVRTAPLAHNVPEGLNVVHVDEHLIVLDKPSGLLSVPGKGPDGADCLSARAQACWADARVVHRLDMATSGLIVMARGVAAQRSLSMAFAQRQTHKRYVAVVTGQLTAPTEGDWGEIDLPLIVDWPNRPRSMVCHTTGKPSLTRWHVLHTDVPRNQTRLLLEPVTGRSHQLRVHLLAIGHPIVGDDLYAPDPVRLAANRLLLHACELTVPHPATSQPVRFASTPSF